MVCKPAIAAPEVEEGGSEVQSHSWLHEEFETGMALTGTLSQTSK